MTQQVLFEAAKGTTSSWAHLREGALKSLYCNSVSQHGNIVF